MSKNSYLKNSTRTAINIEEYTSLDNKFLLCKINNAKERVIILLKAFILYEPPETSDIIRCCRIIQIISIKIRIFIMLNNLVWSNNWYHILVGIDNDFVDTAVERFQNTLELPNKNAENKFNEKDRRQKSYITYVNEYIPLLEEIIRFKIEKYKIDIEKIKTLDEYENLIINFVKTTKRISRLKLYENIEEINQELIIKYQQFIENSAPILRAYSKQSSQVYKKSDVCAQRYLDKCVMEHKQKEEIKRQRQERLEEYEKSIKNLEERQKQFLKIITTPSRIAKSIASSFKKHMIGPSPEDRIQKWNDKIMELISGFQSSKYNKSLILNICIKKININTEIIRLFIDEPNEMIYKEQTYKDKTFQIQINKIYEGYLLDYKNKLTSKDLQNDLYKNLNNDFKHILEVIKNIKIDNCKNDCPQLKEDK